MKNQHTQEILQRQEQEQVYWKSFITGGIAGICAKTVIAPFERIKLLYVTRNKKFSYRLGFQDIQYIYKNHGILNFFRGNGANVIRVFPFASINFSVFDFLRNNVWKPLPDDRYIFKKFVLFLCGSTSGMTATSITYPLEMVRTRLAMEKNNFAYSNVFHGLKVIARDEGVFSLYTGLSMALLGVFVYHGFAFLSVSTFKQNLIQNNNVHAKKWYTDFALGSFASIIGQIISYPIDIVRKRIQGQSFLYSNHEIDKKFNIPDLARHIQQNEGIRGFYKGLSINLVKGPMATGTVWSVKNYLNRKIDKGYDL